eukprot:364662-Chlamydomonas_euryale.AAC.8
MGALLQAGAEKAHWGALLQAGAKRSRALPANHRSWECALSAQTEHSGALPAKLPATARGEAALLPGRQRGTAATIAARHLPAANGTRSRGARGACSGALTPRKAAAGSVATLPSTCTTPPPGALYRRVAFRALPTRPCQRHSTHCYKKRCPSLGAHPLSVLAIRATVRGPLPAVGRRRGRRGAVHQIAGASAALPCSVRRKAQAVERERRLTVRVCARAGRRRVRRHARALLRRTRALRVRAVAAIAAARVLLRRRGDHRRLLHERVHSAGAGGTATVDQLLHELLLQQLLVLHEVAAGRLQLLQRVRVGVRIAAGAGARTAVACGLLHLHVQELLLLLLRHVVAVVAVGAGAGAGARHPLESGD